MGLLGLVARFGSNWLEEVEPMIGGACGSDRGRGMVASSVLDVVRYNLYVTPAG